MELFKKSIVVGISVTPEVGLEAALVDFASQTVLKYGVRPLDYDINNRVVSDLDLLKEALQDLLYELQIPKGSEIVINLPSVTLKVNDYPAALDDTQITNAIEDELAESPIFKNNEAAISAVRLPNSSVQFSKIAYTAAQKQMLVELAWAIDDLGYKLLAIDTSINSTLNTLMYKQRIDYSNDKTWIMLYVDSICCRVIAMNGRDYVDVMEEKISIGKVFDDAENYSTVINAVAPILKNIPSKYLCVVSKTNIISAEVLASKLTYSAPIIHQEANSFLKEALFDIGPDVNEKYQKTISMDVIGAAIYRDFAPYTSALFNMYNSSLGDVYTSKQPPEVYILGKHYVLTNEFLIKLFIMLAVPILALIIAAFIYCTGTINAQSSKVQTLDQQIEEVNKYLKENEDISSELFDEGDEIRVGLAYNKNIYSYYTIVGTEIPKKLWLTHLKLGNKTTIEGQADNLESIYAFFRSIKDYNPNSDLKLQKLALATYSGPSAIIDGDTDSILTSLNADFYEFVISDDAIANNGNSKNESNASGADNNSLPDFEPIKETN